MKIRAFLLILACVTYTSKAFSQNMSKSEIASPQEVIEKVHKAAELLKSTGKEGLEILRDPKSEFTWKDTYIFVIDVEESLVLSNPAFPERQGGNIREHLDWNGKHYGIELCEAAQQGGGWIEFIWPKPGTTAGIRKVSYIYPVPGYRYTVCAGIYNETMTVEKLNKLSGSYGKSSGKVAVIFEVKPKKEGMDEYLSLAANLKPMLSQMDGFISIERFSSLNEEGKLLSLSVWENEEAATKWRNQVAHRESQKAGHDSLFEKYHISVVSVIREYTDRDRTQAPQDSNDYLKLK
ncbi:MAG: antibiotic biosynthesis monooxygenase [Tannerella sp.]|jgi:heme-degrading monooxygenase HmoA|nr:antibiotic biosynthesis monooxygenase [Tannerella sp.]